jgi:hypothetical protein
MEMTWTDIVLCMGEGRNTYTVAVIDFNLVERAILTFKNRAS